ncbi:MerR family transcriptional regulator [Companilactobacillus alimentarius]|uniref:HTH merR-type domain-containing protein n=1 Tax=Companilactobacillus alimentarius DSM 20249 TaxID=1423720 RepID=A0A2K9HHA1_9LACO|nr:hypothetical protein [Companilactobacillus alimentarius]AUI71920.1 hypothetical protein LA20249_06920 [Companilactobacillus alimentarius DSM 20249]KRK77866.1 hypothetical protein FC67_GL001197 [Companilactobacillus alimentarius DSM 20249]MDT6952446.1 hypothetical protein [Companilactobacillus alimentarius]GEO45329.1 transcriptional regulator [Companilactobacillus alimentarius]
MTKVKSNNLLTPAQAAKNLGISVATLRKYSLIVERTTENSDYFERNSQNNRLYTQKNIEDFKEMVKLSHGPKMTLETSAMQIYPTSETKKVQDEDGQASKVKELQVTVAKLESENKKRELTIKELQAELNDAQKSKEQLQVELDTLKQQAEEKVRNAEPAKDESIKERINEKVSDDKKGHWWNKFMG